MISSRSQRIAIAISWIVTIGLFAPSVIKLAHALHGHTLEKRCVDHNTNRIHDTTTHCDFHDVTLAPQVFWISYHCILVQVVFYAFLVFFYPFFFQPYQKDFLPLRGPPLQVV